MKHITTHLSQNEREQNYGRLPKASENESILGIKKKNGKLYEISRNRIVDAFRNEVVEMRSCHNVLS